MTNAARGLIGALGASLLLASTSVARAEAPAVVECPERDRTTCGRRHFEAGTQAFEAGNFRLAAAEFEAAIAQRAHPVIRFNLALSLARLSKPTAALRELRLVLEDPATDQALRARAERELRGAEQAQARVTFRLSDPSRERVELDGELLAAGQGELTLDPGPHHVRVHSASSVVFDQELELSPGERVELRVGERSRRIDVVVVPAEAPPAPAPPPPAPAPRAEAEPGPSRPLSPLWLYGALGATAVLTGVTVWSGVDTDQAFSDYERDLPQLTQAQADERVRDGHRRELRTNLLLAGSIACAAGSAALAVWFVDFRGTSQTRASFGLGHVALSGSF